MTKFRSVFRVDHLRCAWKRLSISEERTRLSTDHTCANQFRSCVWNVWHESRFQELIMRFISEQTSDENWNSKGKTGCWSFDGCVKFDPKSRDEVLPANDSEAISCFHELCEIRQWPYKYKFFARVLARCAVVSLVSISMSQYRKYRTVHFHVCFTRRFTRDSTSPDTYVTCTDTLNARLCCPRYVRHVNVNGRIRTTCAHLYQEAGTSSSSLGAGLAGWYCRAGCGRSSHFGDEISLSNPAPCFICSGAYDGVVNVSLLRLTRVDRLPRWNAPRDVHFGVMRDDKWNNLLLLARTLLPYGAIYISHTCRRYTRLCNFLSSRRNWWS